MKYRINFELVILTLMFVASLKIIIWESIDVTNFSESQKEKTGLGKIHKIGE